MGVTRMMAFQLRIARFWKKKGTTTDLLSRLICCALFAVITITNEVFFHV